MFRIIFSIVAISFLISCSNSKDKRELVPEPDKDIREKYEAMQKLKNSGCVFINPDTSLSTIKLRDSESAIAIIGNKDKMDSLDQYNYYTTMHQEMLTMTQHSGDGAYSISIFKVELVDKIDHGYRKLNIDTFKTEKGIKLGMSKKQIIEKLGTCYAALDSSKSNIELYYKLETPNDSKTKILETNNMPIYYASYKLRNDKLEKFEFGFEYP
jgi:hypothetical protein